MNLQSLSDVRRQLEAIRCEMLGAEKRVLRRLTDLPDGRRGSAANLLHYLALRQHDLRHLQAQLALLGMSSLGRAESRVVGNVGAVLRLLQLIERSDGWADLTSAAESGNGDAHLDRHTRALFGPPPDRRDVRIMVTMPGEAAHDGRLVRELLASGMDCMRINAAHDDVETWGRMVRQLSCAREVIKRPCRVLIDLAGPRLRTAALEAGPPVVRWRPQRDACGRVEKPARVWLTAVDAPRPAPEPAAAVLPVGGSWLAELEAGDVLKLTDVREKRRELMVVSRVDGGVWAESEQTAYVQPSTLIRRKRGHCNHRDTEISGLPATSQYIVLKPGDSLILTSDAIPGRLALVDRDGRVIEPAHIGVTLPQALSDVLPGQAIWFDDGRIGGVIQSVAAGRVEVRIVNAKPDGSRLSGEKGINLPDTDLQLPALTTKDLDDLPFIAAHGDIVGYSFVRTSADVDALQSHLSDIGGRELGLILKIETRKAFEHLPSLLLASMRSPASGVMIARGDLAVECGYERLAEVQEEILWMAEAAHIPVIWATQVLENLAKDGIPSRAEITDAAMGERAECVMLNKGANILAAVRALDDILVRMKAHQRKKSAMLRHLLLADRFFDAQ